MEAVCLKTGDRPSRWMLLGLMLVETYVGYIMGFEAPLVLDKCRTDEHLKLSEMRTAKESVLVLIWHIK